MSRRDLIALRDVWGRWGDANNKSPTLPAAANPAPSNGFPRNTIV